MPYPRRQRSSWTRIKSSIKNLNFHSNPRTRGSNKIYTTFLIRVEAPEKRRQKCEYNRTTKKLSCCYSVVNEQSYRSRGLV